MESNTMSHSPSVGQSIQLLKYETNVKPAVIKMQGLMCIAQDRPSQQNTGHGTTAEVVYLTYEKIQPMSEWAKRDTHNPFLFLIP